MGEPRRRLRVSAAASADFAAILQWTEQTFGRRQAQTYGDLLAATLGALLEGTDVAGSTPRDEILPGLRALHMRRPGRHVVLYRVPEPDVVEVMRILHDAMDIERHLPRGEAGQET